MLNQDLNKKEYTGKKRILLINPKYNYGNSISKTISPPLGLLYLASMVCNEHTVEILDLNIHKGDFIQYLKDYNPSIVGLTSLSPQFPSAVDIATKIKEISGNIKIVLGGVHCNAVGPIILSKFDCFDFLILGDGEYSFQKLVSGKPRKKIKGLVFKEGTKVVNNGYSYIKNLDDLPYPARHLIHLEDYKDFPLYYLNEKHTTIITSRGCPYSCIYCNNSGKSNYGAHSPQRVIAEIKSLDIKDFMIVDDIFTFDKNRVVSICKLIIKEGLDVTWSCQTRTDKVDSGLLKIMKKAGCHLVFFGIETGSKRVMGKINKNVNLEKVKKAISLVKEEGISVRGNFMMGFPFESEEDILQTIKFSNSVGLDGAEFTIVTPYPGTELWKYSKLDENNLDELKTLVYSNFSSHFWDEKELQELYNKAVKSFYLRPSIMLNLVLDALFRGSIKRRIKLLKLLTVNSPLIKKYKTKKFISPVKSNSGDKNMANFINKLLANYCKICPGCFVHKKISTGKSSSEVRKMMEDEVNSEGKAGICPIGKFYDEVYGSKK